MSMVDLQRHSRSRNSMQRMATCVCALATISTAGIVMLTYLYSYPISADYSKLSTRNTYSFVLFTNRTALIHNTTEAHSGKTEDREVTVAKSQTALIHNTTEAHSGKTEDREITVAKSQTALIHNTTEAYSGKSEDREVTVTKSQTALIHNATEAHAEDREVTKSQTALIHNVTESHAGKTEDKKVTKSLAALIHNATEAHAEDREVTKSQTALIHNTTEAHAEDRGVTKSRIALIHNTTEAHAGKTEDKKVTKSRVPSAINLSKNMKHATTVCIMENCLEHLSPAERVAVNRCKRSVMKLTSAQIENGRCNFLSDGDRRAVALASPEGSGNTWLRGLLEKATGICTGFCCCDTEMRIRGFVGEGIVSGKVLVVKTHIVFPQWIGQAKKVKWEGSYDSAIFLIRNPAKALIAEWSRIMTNRLKRFGKRNATNNTHVNVISRDLFSRFAVIITY